MERGGAVEVGPGDLGDADGDLRHLKRLPRWEGALEQQMDANALVQVAGCFCRFERKPRMLLERALIAGDRREPQA